MMFGHLGVSGCHGRRCLSKWVTGQVLKQASESWLGLQPPAAFLHPRDFVGGLCQPIKKLRNIFNSKSTFLIYHNKVAS